MQSGNVLAIGLFTPALRRLRRDCMGRPTPMNRMQVTFGTPLRFPQYQVSIIFNKFTKNENVVQR